MLSFSGHVIDLHAGDPGSFGDSVIFNNSLLGQRLMFTSSDGSRAFLKREQYIVCDQVSCVLLLSALANGASRTTRRLI